MRNTQKKKHGYTKKRTWGILLFALLFLLETLYVPDMEAKAASLSMSVNKSSVKIGETVTVSITVPAGVSATVNLTYPSNIFTFSSASETANANGGSVVMTLGGYGGTNTTTTGTVKFKAKSAGTATFVASAPTAGNQEGDPVSVGGASASVTVKNEAEEPADNGNSNNNNSNNNNSNNNNSNNNNNNSNNNNNNNSNNGNTTNQDDNANKSRDNSLASLTLSAGKLSPDFVYSTVNYTTTVDYSVTSVVVSAKASNAKATIESVTGGENLVVGENKIQIVVKAENGVAATYTIKVTRKAEGETVDNPVEPEPEPEPAPVDPAEKCYLVNGKTLFPTKEVPENWAVEGFTQTEVTLWDEVYPALEDTFYAGGLKLIYLQDAEGTNKNAYLVLGKQLYEAYDFVTLHAENGFLIILPDGKGENLEGYKKGTASLQAESNKLIEAWFYGEEKEFPLVFGVNQQGRTGWYMLDLTDLTYMRYVEMNRVEEPKDEEPEPAPVVPVDTTDSKKVQELENKLTLIIGGAVIIVLILLIIIILMAIWRHGSSDDEDEVYETTEDNTSINYMMEAAEAGKRYDKSTFAKDSGDTDYAEEIAVDEVDTEVVSEQEDTSEQEVESEPEDSVELETIDISSVVNEADDETEIISEEAGTVEVTEEQPEIETEPAVTETEEYVEDSEDKPEQENTSKDGEAEDEAEMARKFAEEIRKMSEVNPMGEISTHKDADDDDLEFIDL